MSPASPYRPPDGYVQLPSQVDGIVVFAPAPDDDGPKAPTTTSCTQCGAPVAFDIGAQAVVCDRCGTEAVRAVAVGALSNADGHEFTLEALRRGAVGWGTERRTLHCDGCGADLVVEPTALTTTCPLCASNKVELLAADEAAVRPGFVLPFRVLAGDLHAPVRSWLGKGWMHPGSLGTLARVDHFVGLYVPYWIFDADVDASYECEVGTDRTVTRRDSQGNTRTVTETTWRWTRGTVSPRFTGVRVPGTTRMSQVLLGRTAAAFELGDLVPYQPELLAGFQAQAYDVALPDAWEQGRALVRDMTRMAATSDAGGDRVRNMSLTAALDNEVWRYVLLPVYVTAYRFDGRTFQVMVNGRSGVVHGQKPVVWWRIYAVITLFLLPAVCSGLLGLPLLLLGGAGLFFLILGFILLVFAIIGAVGLYRSALDAEAA